MDDSNVVKVLALGFNELCVVWICCGQVTDVVISPFSSPFSTACNSHAWRGEGVEMMHCSAPSVMKLVFFQPTVNHHVDCYIHCPSAVSAWWPTSSEGSPRESLSSMQGSKAGKDGDKRYAVWCSSLVSGGKDSTNPQSNESNQCSSTSNAGIMFYFLQKPHIYSVMCSLKDSPPDNTGVTGGFHSTRSQPLN